MQYARTYVVNFRINLGLGHELSIVQCVRVGYKFNKQLLLTLMYVNILTL